MKMRAFVISGIVFATAMAAFTLPGRDQGAGAEKRESILDRKVHIEKQLITEIPKVARLCDGLSLKKQRINVGDCEIYVEEEGQGVPLVLINGGPGGTHHYFHPWFSRIKDKARVIYYDQRGCGLSDYIPGPNGYSVGQAVVDLEAMRSALGIEKWIVLGYSYGGFLAQYYATIHPERLLGLVLLGALPGMWVEMNPTRQYDFLSKEERDRMKDIRAEIRTRSKTENWPPEKTMAIMVFNNHLNGDWKRQHFYRPSLEKMAQGAVYEWTYDLKNDFNSAMGRSQGKIDLSGAFESFPVPTLILEGKWDLTWNTDKPEILAKNHPGAKTVVFENAGHGIYDEEPDRFFDVLKEFLGNIAPVSPSALAAYKAFVPEWDRQKKASPSYVVRVAGFGRSEMIALARAYKREWCDAFDNFGLLLKLGFAQYETANYGEGLYVFEKMQAAMEKKNDPSGKALALVWQGHMLDLQGKRAEAIARYDQVAKMNIRDTWEHSQYGLAYEVSAYAKEKLDKPFVRVENKEK